MYASAQDLAFGKKMVDTLTSPRFWGRGYTNDGMKKAADFLAAQFQSYGLVPMGGKNFLQEFTYPVNTFPGKMELMVNGRQLKPGKDFIVAAESRGLKGDGKLLQSDSVQFINQKDRVIVKLENKLTMSVSQQEADYTIIQVDKQAVLARPFFDIRTGAQAASLIAFPNRVDGNVSIDAIDGVDRTA